MLNCNPSFGTHLCVRGPTLEIHQLSDKLRTKLQILRDARDLGGTDDLVVSIELITLYLFLELMFRPAPTCIRPEVFLSPVKILGSASSSIRSFSFLLFP